MISPIVIFCYRRSISNLLASLQKNPEYPDTQVYVFSDGWKSDEDSPDVLNVRKELSILKKKPGFIIFESDRNKGLANSIIDGVSYVIEKHGSAIVLEDDLEVSPHFLKYMNTALQYYENDDRIWSISGYSPPVFKDKDFDFDVYLFCRGSSWGWATWAGRWNKVDWEVSDFQKLVKDKKMRKQFERGGNDLFKMLELQVLGKIDSWAIRWYYSQFVSANCTVYPKKTLVINHGFNDGLGTHTTGNYNKWSSHDLSDEAPDVTRCSSSKSTFNKIKDYHDIGLVTKIGYFTKKYGGYRFLKKMQMLILTLQRRV